MNFFKSSIKSGLGAVAALAIYGAVTCALVYGTVDLTSLVVNSLIGGALFGVVFATVHVHLQPTCLSSVLTGFGFVTAVTLVSLYMAGTFVGWSIASVVALVAAALLIGTGGFIGHRIGR